MVIIKNSFPTEKSCKERIINKIKDSLSSMQVIPLIDEKDFNLILDEAIINAMEHGNRWDPDKEIMIQLCFNGKTAELLICDEGSGFDYNGKNSKTPEKPHPDIRGRGIMLIKKLSKSEWINNGNTIKISIPINMTSCL